MRRVHGWAACLAVALGLAAGAARAEDPPDMATLARLLADDAPGLLSRPVQGPPQIPNYTAAQFRNVRANYQRHDLINDQIAFCGEINIKDPKTGAYSGWTKFAYLPGDPPTVMSTLPGFGLREIGPQVLHTLCETGKEKWLTGDFSDSFRKPPGAAMNFR